MNLLFMQNGLPPYGIPLNGLIALFDPGRQILTGTTGQTLVDYTGRGNNAQLGSAAGADTNDPAWSGAGLVFGADDYCKSSSPAFDDLAAFTCITVCKPLSEGGGSTGRLFDKNKKIFRFTSGMQLVYQQSRVTGTDTWVSAQTVSTSPICVIIGYDGINKPIVSVGTIPFTISSGGSGSGACATDASYDLYIGNASSATRNFDGTIYLQLWYNRVLSDAEYMQAYNGLRRLMNSRGVVI